MSDKQATTPAHLHSWQKRWVRLRGADGILSHVPSTVCTECLLAYVRRGNNEDYSFILLLLKETGREPKMERDGFYFTVTPGDVV